MRFYVEENIVDSGRTRRDRLVSARCSGQAQLKATSEVGASLQELPPLHCMAIIYP